MVVYVLNPGSTSTKLGLAEVTTAPGGAVVATVEKHEIQHPDLRPAPVPEPNVAMSLIGPTPGPRGFDEAALEHIRGLLREASRDWPAPDGVSARGGIIGPVPAGTYRVTPNLAEFSLASPYGSHPANAGAALALEWARPFNVPAFIVDPPTVDELLPEARVSGVPGVERRSRFHALNARAVARRTAREVGKRFADATIVVAHLGGGVSVTCFEKGRAVDTSVALLDEGPWSVQRAGTLPLSGVLDLAYGLPRAELERRLTRESGFKGLLGTADVREVEARVNAGDEAARVVLAAFELSVAKHIGMYATVASRPDAIAITGGVARFAALMERLEARLGWIAPVLIVPGELELEALAEGAGRVLLGAEPAREWKA